MSTKSRPSAGEYAPVYQGYVALAGEGDVLSALRAQSTQFEEALRALPPQAASYRYAEGKWSVAQLLRHVTDAERVFSYRALSFARGDSSPLPSFEENDWAAAASVESVPLTSLLEEFVSLRRANVLLFEQMTDEAWLRDGVAAENRMSVRAVATIIEGHARHHLTILEQRYLPALR